MSKVFLTNVSVSADQRVKAAQVSGRTIVMSSDTTVKGPDGAAILSANHVYALDRVTLDAAPAPGRQQRCGGTHRSKAILPSLANALPPAIQQALTQFLPGLPESMPLTYTSTTDYTFWVDKATGIVIDADQQQVIKAQLGGVLSIAPLPNAFDLNIRTTDETVKANAAEAEAAENGLKLIGTYLPIGLAALGALLLVFATFHGPGRSPHPYLLPSTPDAWCTKHIAEPYHIGPRSPRALGGRRTEKAGEHT